MELREKVYEFLFDSNIPRTVPQNDDANTKTLTPRKSLSTTDIFHDEYIFNPNILGPVLSSEIQALVLRTTPIYFRGCVLCPDVAELLDMQLASGDYVRDLIRHLRVYLRFDRFHTEKTNEAVPSWLSILPRKALFTPLQLKMEIYKAYSARADGIMRLPFREHTIKVEMCVFYKSAARSRDAEGERVRFNLFETVRRAYKCAKREGAHVSVRLEDIEKGDGGDASALYDESEAEVCCL
jgi:hypothetical protein